MTNPQTNPGLTATSQAWAGNMPLDAFTEAARIVGGNAEQRTASDQRFWSTPKRPAADTSIEVLQFTMGNQRLVNRITFEVAVFPHEISVEYYDPFSSAWLPCLEARQVSPTPVTATVLESMPAMLPPVSMVIGHLHPQHSYSGHWRPVRFHIRPVETTAIRILLTRTTRGVAPVDPLNQPVDYSLAVRNVYLGYRVVEKSDVPYTPPGLVGDTRDTFATTTDMFGSVVEYAVRVNRARNVLGPALAEPGEGLTSIWKCDPQPVPWAVVNFYVDTRDPSGQGQVLDRFFVEPLYDGPSCNLYFSNDEPTEDFQAKSDPLPPQMAVVHNAGGVVGDVLRSGAARLGTIAFIDVDNTSLSFDPSRPWWIGMRLRLKFPHGTQSATYPILDCDEFALAMTPFGLRITTRHGDTLGLRMSEPFDMAVPMTFVAAYDGLKLTLTARTDRQDYEGTLPVSVALTASVETIRIGGDLGIRPGPNNFDLDAFVLKIDEVPSAETIADFIDEPEPYAINSGFLETTDPKTDNALLRYHPDLWTEEFPTGLVGGPPDRYEQMAWTPISRDFRLRKGYLRFPPTRAKYWKMEFCDLVPKVCEVYRPVERKVQTFPSGMWVSHTPGPPISAQAVNELIPGLDGSTVVNAMTQSFDHGMTPSVGTMPSGLFNTDTSARVLIDNNARARLGGAYWAWNFLPLHSLPGQPPTFSAKGKHKYEVINYRHTTKFGFFVGLRALRAFRLEQQLADDTQQYVELFHDTSRIDPETNWVLAEDHRLFSGAAHYAEVRSIVLESNRVVTGVQFAAQQSDAEQLLADPDLDNEQMPSWDPVGDAILSPRTTNDPVLKTTIQVDRSSPPLTWDRVTAGYRTWHDILSQNATFGMVERGTQLAGEAGGIMSLPVSTPPGGRIYVAARAMAPADLTSPLYVQVIEDETDEVLSESAIDVKANKVTEWYTGYTIGEGITAFPWRWKDFYAEVSSVLMVDDFVHPNGTPLPAMTSGHQWSYPVDTNGNPLSLSISANRAVVTAEGQSNHVDTESIWGTLQFQVGTMGASASANVWLARFMPLQLDDTGKVSLASGVAYVGDTGGQENLLTTNGASRNVLANDVIRIDILPTIHVPAGKEDIFSPSTNNIQRPYSVMVWLNGTWVRTLSHDFGVLPIKGIKGRLNQQFRSWSWTPADYGPMYGPVVSGMPRKGNGAWVDAESKTTWVTNDGREWLADGTWDVTNDPETAAADNVGATLVASSNDATFTTETGVWAGTIQARVRNIAGTNGQTPPSGRHGNVLCLDYDNDLYLDYAGRIVKDGVAITQSLFPGGILAGQTVGVQFVHMASVPEANRPSGHDLQTHPYGLYGKIDGDVVGVWYGDDLQTWPQGTRRGVAGDMYDPVAMAASSPLNGNPTFETDAAGWFGSGGTFARSTAQAVQGVASGLLTPNGSTATVIAGVPLANAPAVTVGTQYQWSAWVYSPNGYSAIELAVSWYNSSNSLFNTTDGGAVAVPAGEWTLLTMTATAPATAVKASPRVYIRNTPPTSAVLYIDNAELIRPASPGTRPAGASYTLDTAFQSFNWAPDAINIAAKASEPTWDSVTSKGSITYGQIEDRGDGLDVPKLRAQVVQKGPSKDVFYLDSVAMYADPIIWFFSNDGGFTWIPAYDIRNNPNGVVTFPESVGAVDIDQKPGTGLVWRAVSYQPGSSIASLVIRPWYAGVLSGVMHRAGLVATGPNVMPFDEFGDIRKDARFQTWNLPIPRDWWYQHRLLRPARTFGPVTAVSPTEAESDEPTLFLTNGLIFTGGPS